MQKIIVVVGPTGIGKSKLSIELAKKYNGEIISGDAYQVYKNMDIGTAKIRLDEQQGIVHHLVDCYNINDEFNVKEFQKEGRRLIKDIQSRNKTVIVCGGTGLYIKALLYDYEFSEEKKDQTFLKGLANKSNEELYQQLETIDPKACEKIHINNRQRIIRALEMAHNGETKSSRIERQNHELLYDAIFIGLSMDRDKLYQRINLRVDKMFTDGLVDEVNSLVNNLSDFDKQAMKAIGYKEFKAFYQQEKTLDEVKEAIKLNTRRFAKRQYTWFKNQMEIKWFDIENPNYLNEIIKYIEENKNIESTAKKD